jgi:hypothetical protein
MSHSVLGTMAVGSQVMELAHVGALECIGSLPDPVALVSCGTAVCCIVQVEFHQMCLVRRLIIIGPRLRVTKTTVVDWLNVENVTKRRFTSESHGQ